MELRDDLLADAKAIGEALTLAYQPRVAAALRTGDPREIEIVKLNFETEYRRATNHIVCSLAMLPPPIHKSNR